MPLNSLNLRNMKQISNILGQILLQLYDATFSQKVAVYLQFNSNLVGTE